MFTCESPGRIAWHQSWSDIFLGYGQSLSVTVDHERTRNFDRNYECSGYDINGDFFSAIGLVQVIGKTV